jgi:parallel beta-helix repeat protein
MSLGINTRITNTREQPTPFGRGNTLYVGGTGDGNYSKIQDAIDDAIDGDTVYVYSGTYYEQVGLDKSINLIGENRDTTIIDANYKSSCIYIIRTNGITVSGFTLQNSGDGWYDAGIKIRWSNFNNITGNTIMNNNYGIYQTNSNSNILMVNNIRSNNSLGKAGIALINSNNNTLKYNFVTNNSISLRISTNNNIIGNSFINTGLMISDSYGNIVENNMINGKPIVYLENESDKVIDDAGQVLLINCDNISVQNQELSNTTIGIWLWDTNNSHIFCNTISSNNIGINPHYSHNNIFSNNYLSNNWCGILQFFSNNSTITRSTFTNNFYGINNFYSNNSYITLNNLINNKYGARIGYSKNNTITNNNIRSNTHDGISLDYSTNNKLLENNITLNLYSGIQLSKSNNNIIKDNNINSNDCGIRLSFDSNLNTIIGNTITLNDHEGISLPWSNNNIIYHNNFINNTNNANDECNNTWDDGKYGNYWSDYEERYPDAKKIWMKSIWDTPYEIPGGDNKDMHPLIEPWSKSKPRTIQKDIVSYSSYLLRFLEQFPILQKILLFQRH